MLKTNTDSERFIPTPENKESLAGPGQKEAEKLWSNFLVILSDSLKKSEIDTWFSVLSPKTFENNVLTLVVPSKDYYEMIERRFNKQISNILKSGLLGENGVLNYEIIQESLFDVPRQEPAEKTANDILSLNSPFKSTSFITHRHEAAEPFVTNIIQKHTFDNFVKGESNELAVATAYAITNNPGKSYNPYFVYGGVGLGKTHLIQAIGNEILKKHPDKKVYYTTTPDFTTQFTSNIAKDRIGNSDNKSGTKQLDEFYKNLDVLILDDIQNLRGKPGTQDFMYQIFNALYNNNKHIIFSCDKPLSQIKDIEERLISRFHWGITVDIQPPSWEMRVAIIKKKLDENDFDMPEEIIHYVASNVKSSVRAIEGCIAGMIAESFLVRDCQITLGVAERVINRIVGSTGRIKNISVDNIINCVSRFFKISENQILTRNRKKEVAFARQVAMYLAKEMTNLTFETIGLNFGGKDHATVIYSHKTIKELIKKDRDLLLKINEIIENIKNL